MTAASQPRRRIGSLLVQLGFVTNDEIEQALSVQVWNQKLLGELLVEKGLVSRPALTKALAEQQGVKLEEESGFGSGLRAAIEQRHRVRRLHRLDRSSEPGGGGLLARAS